MGKVWIFRQFSLETWLKSSGISLYVSIVLVHTDKNVHDSTYLVELVHGSELTVQKKLVSIGGEILMEPEGVAIVTSSLRSGTESWDPLEDGLSSWDDVRHLSGGSWSQVEVLDSVPWESGGVFGTSWTVDSTFMVETNRHSYVVTTTARVLIKSTFVTSNKIPVSPIVTQVRIWSSTKQWYGSWNQKPQLCVTGFKQVRTIIIMSEFVQKFVDNWSGFIVTVVVWVFTILDMGSFLSELIELISWLSQGWGPMYSAPC